MRHSLRLLAAVGIASVALATTTVPARADSVSCHKTIIKQLYKFKRIYLKKNERCLDKENKLAIPGPCPDTDTQSKIATVNSKVTTMIAAGCTMPDLVALGYRSDCAYETAATAGKEADCAALPVTTPSEFSECMKCWKGAEMSEFLALLFASHANEVCGGSLDESSPKCSDLDCTTPLPDQRNLGDTGENDCQKGLSKAGVKYLLKRAKVLEKCLVAGGTQSTCLADSDVQLSLQKIEDSKTAGIKRNCGNRSPSPSPAFCCQCGTANSCMLISDRTTCAGTTGCVVQEGKSCDGGTLKCTPTHEITWWSNCPESGTCPGASLSTLDDLIACVDSSADQIADEVLCLQFPGYPCPPTDPEPTPTP